MSLEKKLDKNSTESKEKNRSLLVFTLSRYKNEINIPFVKHNKKVIDTVINLWDRAKGDLKNAELLSKLIYNTHSYLYSFYGERLGSISSEEELEKATQDQKTKLELNIDDLVSAEERIKILEENPDSINFLGKDYPIIYSNDRIRFNEKGDTESAAFVTLLASDILKLTELPTLPPLGRKISFEIISKIDDEESIKFIGTELESLKKKSQEFILREQWYKWCKNEGKNIWKKRLENFNIFSDFPELPESIPFGIDPKTQEPILAFPSLIVQSTHFDEDYDPYDDRSFTKISYFIQYFPSIERAEKAKGDFLVTLETVRTEQRNKEHEEEKITKEDLLVPIRELLDQVNKKFSGIIYDTDYRLDYYGLSHIDSNDIRDKITLAREQLPLNPQEVLKNLQKLDGRINKILDYKKQKDLASEKVDTMFNEHYNVCPLCSQPFEHNKCTNSEHNLERIKFDLDDVGHKTGPVILSQIITDKGQVAVQLRVSHGEVIENSYYYPGTVYFADYSDFKETAWTGEPFESLKFEDFRTN